MPQMPIKQVSTEHSPKQSVSGHASCYKSFQVNCMSQLKQQNTGNKMFHPQAKPLMSPALPDSC